MAEPLAETDETDGVGDVLKEIFQPIHEEFKELIGENEGKKSFIGGSIKIFTILLNSRATTLTKIKNVLRLRMNSPTFVAAPGQGIGNKNMKRRHSMFKIKTLATNCSG